MKPAFPFLWFGRRPADWYEGANDGHAYEVCFVRAPDPKARKAIAAAFAKALRGGGATLSSEPWLWSERFALLLVGEKTAGDIDACFDAVDRALRACHAIAPIEQVVFAGTRGEPKHAWDAFTKAAKRAALAGPAWPEYTLPDWFRRGVTAAKPAKPAKSGKPTKFGLVPLADAPTAPVHATLGSGAEIASTGAAIADLTPGGDKRKLTFIDARGKRHALAKLDKLIGGQWLTALAIDDAGTVAWCGLEDYDTKTCRVVTCALPSGAARVWFEVPAKLGSVTAIAGGPDGVHVLCKDGLVLVDAGGEVVATGDGGSAMLALSDGSLIVVGPNDVRRVRRAGTKLATIATAKPGGTQIWRTDDRVIVGGYRALHFELAGL